MGTKITSLEQIAADTLASDDFLVVLDTSAGELRKIAADDIADHLISSFGLTALTYSSASALMDDLSISAFAQTLVDDANLVTFLTTMGLDADLATLSLPASMTIDSFALNWLGLGSAGAIGLYLGTESPWTTATTATLGTSPTELVTGISSAREIWISVKEMSTATNLTSVVFQIGGDSGYVSSGYHNNESFANTAGSKAEVDRDTGFSFLYAASNSNTEVHSGYAYLYRWDMSEDIWFYESFGNSDNENIVFCMGWLDLTEDLTKIQAVTGAGDFDDGSVVVRYRQ